jgi:hypothetical protein
VLKFGVEQDEIRQRIIEKARQEYGKKGESEEEKFLGVMREPEKHFRVQPDHKDAVAESLKHIERIAKSLYFSMNWTICQAPWLPWVSAGGCGARL